MPCEMLADGLEGFLIGSDFLLNDASDDFSSFIIRDLAVSLYRKLVC